MDQSDIQRLIGEAAKRHGVLLGPHDPLFITVTLNELVLAHHIERTQAAIKATQDQIAAGAAEHRQATKAMADRAIAGGANYVAKVIGAAVAEIEPALRMVADQQIAAIRQADFEEQEARRYERMATLLAVGVVAFLLGTASALWLQG
jgi:hypothetical protein